MCISALTHIHGAVGAGVKLPASELEQVGAGSCQVQHVF